MLCKDSCCVAILCRLLSAITASSANQPSATSPTKSARKPLGSRQQKQAVVDLIKKRTNQLLWEMTILEKSRNFCPNKLEQLIREVRHWQQILNQVLEATVSEIAHWYEKLVLSR